MIAKVIQVIETDSELRGDGNESSPFRRVKQYYSLDGQLLAEVDPGDGSIPKKEFISELG